MRTARMGKTRAVVIGAIATSVLAGGLALGATTDLLTTAAPAGNGSTDKVALAGQNANVGDEPCIPIDERLYPQISSGWASAETVEWENRANASQKHTFTFTQTVQASGGISGELNLAPAKKKKKELKLLGKTLGFELALEASISNVESVEYTVPARSRFIAKRGIKKETRAIKRHQRWSNCKERWTHLGTVTGVRPMYYTSTKVIRFPTGAAAANPSSPSRPAPSDPSSVDTTGPIAIAGDQL